MKNTLINGRWELLLPDHRAARPEWDITLGGWETARLNHMADTIKTGDRVLYIGAEEGDMCGLLASWGAELVLAEPNELVWPNIRAIWEANDLIDPLGCYTGFCGRQSSPGYASGWAQKWPESAYGPLIGDHGFKELRDPGHRPVVAVDDMCMRFDVISLDVEGSEWEVLQGAEQTLREHHPVVYLSLHPEFLHDQYGKYGAEVRRWLIDLGYQETLLDYPMHEVHLVYR